MPGDVLRNMARVSPQATDVLRGERVEEVEAEEVETRLGGNAAFVHRLETGRSMYPCSTHSPS
jgi:hypothetical protein